MPERANLPSAPRDKYASFAELAAYETEGLDYRVIARPVPGARVAIVAPHGGGIERGTSELARVIAGEDFHLYLFEGLKPRGNFKSLHITSRRFDEPRCADLLRRSETVITIHGCAGLHQAVYLGGLHAPLKATLVEKLLEAGIDARLNGHVFPAIDGDNLCNRGLRGAGVQLELTAGLRRGRPSTFLGPLIRDILLAHHF
jgi:phage replication-related protein YjqB (UPF0714/DUF867 family)